MLQNPLVDIRVVGMPEWDDGRYVRNFINSHNGLSYLDGITYHKYIKQLRYINPYQHGNKVHRGLLDPSFRA